MKPADAAKRVNMSEADLRFVNNIPQRMTIRAGSSLLVPRPANLARDVTLRIADNGQVSLSRDIVLHRVVLKAGRNDSVASVAKRHRLSAASVAEWNKVGVAAAFRPEQQIVVWLPNQPRAARKKSTRSVKTATHRKAAPAKQTQLANR